MGKPLDGQEHPLGRPAKLIFAFGFPAHLRDQLDDARAAGEGEPSTGQRLRIQAPLSPPYRSIV